MTHYLLAFHGGSAPETAEQAVALQQSWAEWLGGLDSALVDAGGPFGDSLSVTGPGQVHPEGDGELSGYSIVAASSLEEAADLAGSSPIFAGDGTVEVYEVLPL